MKGLRCLAIGFGLVATLSAFSAQAPSCDALISAGLAKAKAEHKNVLLDFRASWCSWCRRLDVLFQDPRFRDKFEQSYVIVPITVRETPAHAAEENHGWAASMLKYRKYKDQDIPYEVVLSPTGEKLTDSYEKYGTPLPSNAGFPQTSNEIEAYMELLKETAPSFSPHDRDDLRAYFVAIRDRRAGH